MRRTSTSTAVIVGLALAGFGPAFPRLARAQPAGPADPPPPLSASLRLDGPIIAGALTVAGLAALVPVDTHARWTRELVPLDAPVRDNFSAGAARTSDLLLAVAVLTPLALQAGQGFSEETGRRTLVYGETMAVSLALNAATKYLVARPRPYAYNPDPRVAAYVRDQRKDAYLSFYSGHAATAFAAAVSGGYLFSQSTNDTGARTAVWASGLLLAGATANLRVRAGKHFYSDVAVGALAGAGVGLAVPLLHYQGQATHALTAPEWIAIATAPLAGVALSQLAPMASDITEPLTPRAAGITESRLLPWLTGKGGGLALVGSFR